MREGRDVKEERDSSNLVSLKAMIRDEFTGRQKMIFDQLCNVSSLKQPTDICITSGEPFLDVIVDVFFLKGLNDMADAESFENFINNIQLLSKDNKEVGTVAFTDICAVYPIPYSGISDEALANVDMDEGDEEYGRDGETLRELIKINYKCKNDEETEKFLRRYLAS